MAFRDAMVFGLAIGIGVHWNHYCLVRKERCPSRQTESKQGRGLRRARPPPRRRPSELIAILAHKGGGRPQPDADFAIGADKRAFGGNAADDVFGGERPPGWRILGHGVKAVPGPRSLSKTP